MLAPGSALAQAHWARKGSPEPAAIAQTARDLRVARALRLRRDNIHYEMTSWLHRREECHRHADAYVDEFEELAEADKALRTPDGDRATAPAGWRLFPIRRTAENRSRPYR
jgi:hypothetical protein